MMMIYKKYGAMLAYLNQDMAKIERNMPTINEDGSRDNDTPSVIAENIPCHISFKTQDIANLPIPNGASQPTTFIAKVFFSTGIDVKAGDKITVTRFDGDGIEMGIYIGLAGLPSKYRGHIEIMLFSAGRA